MAEKKQKILAREYFKDSVLFDADVLSGMDNSATSSSVEYELTCKECGAISKRKGNAKTLRTCSGCKRVWNREDNTIEEPPVKEPKAKAAPKAKAKAKPVEESESEEEVQPVKRTSTRLAEKRKAVQEDSEEEVAPVPRKKAAKKEVVVDDESSSEIEEPVAKKAPAAKKLPDHDVDILAQILKGEIEPHQAKAQPKKLKNAAPELDEDEHWVEEILDYYDDYENGRWHRFYYCKWWNDDTLTFTRADNFSDQTMVEKYEKSLPTSERFKNMFPNPKISKRTGQEKIGYRTKADVENDREDSADVVEETVRHKIELDIVYLKAGHRYFDRKSKTLFLLDGDKDLDQIIFQMM